MAADRIAYDCGATSLVALRRAGVDPQAVDAVVVTHLHGDHFAGLPFLVLNGQFRRPDRDLTIVGPSGTQERLHAAMETLFPRVDRGDARIRGDSGGVPRKRPSRG